MNFKADLHCHSVYSDGTLDPHALLMLAKEQGLSGLSITDHDTTLAYTDMLFQEAERLNIRLLAGVEFSCHHKGHSIHVLGYRYTLDNKDLKMFSLRHVERRRTRNCQILDKLAKLGMPIAYDELLEIKPLGIIGRPHIAYLLMKKGYISSFQEAFNRYIGDGKCCYVKGETFTLAETLNIIHKAGGKAFIAHPHLIPKKQLINELITFPFNGIECYYSLFPREAAQPWVDFAMQHNLLISGGSDFHGEIKPHIPLGASWVDEETFNKIVFTS
jgi:hypothetical protein